MHDAHVVDGATNTVSVASSRCMFIAGFAYYELGRFGFYAQDRPYLILLSGALTFAVLGSGVGAYFQLFMYQLHGKGRIRGRALYVTADR